MSYLSRLQAKNRTNMCLDGTAKTAKTNLRSLCSSHLTHFQQINTPALKVGTGDTASFDREWFEERAGILEYDAGFPRQEAERLALLEVMKND